MKLKFFIKNNKKTYTLKDKVNNTPTKPAHYKFIKVRDAPKSKIPLNSKKIF